MMLVEYENAILLRDGLKPYAETVPGRFPVEPFNAVSSLAFLVVAIYWARKTRMKIIAHPVIVISVPVLVVGALAGALHHAFRDFREIRHLDMVMAFYGVAMACLFFWKKVSDSWVMAFSMTLLFPLLFRFLLPDPHHIDSASVVYVAMAIALLPPVALYCANDGMRHFEYPLLASVFFVIGIILREADAYFLASGYPIGTHFLWHVFGALTVCAFFGYAYAVDKDM